MPATGLLAVEFTATSTYTAAQYQLVLYSFVVATFALFATGLYSATNRSEISKAYRTSTGASTLICWVATLAYVVLTIQWLTGFEPSADGRTYTPLPGTLITELRYMDWSVTVPVLAVEVLGVAVLTRAATYRLRLLSVSAAFLMIVTGFLGVVFGQDATAPGGAGGPAMWIWGAISTVFFLVMYGVALQAYRATAPAVGAEVRTSYRNALVLLFSVFGAYPLLYLVPAFVGASSGAWGTTEQLVFTTADIAAKAGFGLTIHKVAKLRTAEDALKAGGRPSEQAAASVPETNPSEVWVSGQLMSLPPYAVEGLAPRDGARTPTRSSR